MIHSLNHLAFVGAVVAFAGAIGTGTAQAADVVVVNKYTCHADGGTFAVAAGVRQCTKVITYTESLGVTRTEGLPESDEQLGTVRYAGEEESFVTIRYTTVTAQRGNEEPTMSGGDEVLSSWRVRTCTLHYSGGSAAVDNSECDSRGLFSNT